MWNEWWQLVSGGYYCTPNSCNIESQGRTTSEWYSPPFPHSSVARDLPGWVWQPSGSLHLSQLSWTEVLFHIYLAAGVIGRLHPPWFWAIDPYWEVAADSPLCPPPTSNTAVLQGGSEVTFREEPVSQRSIPPLPFL